MSHNLCPFAIDRGQNWWQTTLEIKVSCSSQWEGSTCTLQGSSFFCFWGRWVGEVFFVFFHVPNVFPLCSHHVPWSFSSSQVVPQNFPNSTSVLSHMVCPKFNLHVCKLTRWSMGEHFCFHFATQGQKRCFYWGVPNVPKTLVMAEWMWLLSIKKKVQRTHEYESH
jgi:hypothetical protein